MRARLRETPSLDVLRQAVGTQGFSNGAEKNHLSATPPSIRAWEYVFICHPAQRTVIARENQRGMDASCFENKWLSFDSTIILCKSLLSLCLAIQPAVKGCSPSKPWTTSVPPPASNPASSAVLLAPVQWGSWPSLLRSPALWSIPQARQAPQRLHAQPGCQGNSAGALRRVSPL